MNNKNYRVMKFFEPVDKKDKYRGYVRLDMRGNRGNMIVAAENIGDAKSTSEVYLYKDKHDKIKLGDINNKKGIIKKVLTFGNNNSIEDYSVCAVVNKGKIVLYSNLFSTSSPDIVRKLEEDEEMDVKKYEEEAKTAIEPKTATGPKTGLKTEEKIETKIEPKTETKLEPKIMPRAETKETINVIKDTLQDNEIKETINDAITEPIKTVTVKEKKYRNKFDENLYNTLRDYKEVEPLSVKLKNFTWWYVPYDEMGLKTGILPYYNQIISSYYPYPMSARVTTCAGLMKKYGHYIFGIYKENDEIAKFIYGVPGEFTKEEQPYKGVTGFKNWSYGAQDNKDDGYWLAFVDPKTGETTEPPQIS